jgi:ABC-type transport system substrate-binding protein
LLLIEPAASMVGSNLFDSLTDYDPMSGQLIPAAAVTWAASPDRRIWTFKLRAEALFHDGTPVRAGDFVRAWSRLADSRNGVAGSALLSAIEGWEE